MRAVRRLLALLLLAVTVAVSPGAAADVGARLPKLAGLHRAVKDARDRAYAYLALRQLWQEWDKGEPSEVEEVLSEVAADTAEPAPVRAYAGLLQAYARRRRGDLDGAKSRIAGLGYVERWLVLGPFENDGKAGFDTAYEPESMQTVPIDLTRDYDAFQHHREKWRLIPAVSPYAWVDLTVFVRPNENVCSYAVTFVRDSRTAEHVAERNISVWAGAQGAVKAWWNNAPIFADPKYRDLDWDRMAANVTLRQGWNRLMVKACGAESGGPMFGLRIAGADGAPDEHLEVSADPSHSTSQGGAVVSLGRGAPAARGPSQVEGSLQAFERIARGDDPAALEAFARFLTITDGDDPSEHRARDLATRAAERAPTVPRLLLAGDLAENRNQRASWIERAEAVVARGGVSEDDKLAALLARAGHTASGPNWRDAVPYYDRALAADPDNVAATLSRVELYERAGLRETGLVFLDQALSRRPKSIAFLRSMAALLQKEERTTESEELAERYAELRFDDPTFARTHLDLAVARRDGATAERWIERLLATNPDSFGAIQAAAASYVSLGERPRAVALYQKALQLAPEDTDAMQALANVYALSGQRDEQLKLLRQVLYYKPNLADVREYVARSEPPAPKPDEVYARPSSEFLAKRSTPADAHATRTLVSLQVTTVFPSGLASRFHQVAFQPMTDDAAREAQQYVFGFEADTQAVQLRGARVYRADGHADDALGSGDQPAGDDLATQTYTNARAFIVSFPPIQKGDVVEIQYRIEDIAERNVFSDYFGEVVYMQSSSPLLHAEYHLLTPKARTFHFNDIDARRTPWLRQQAEERGDQRIFHFVADNVPAVDSEPGQPPYTEVLAHVHVSTFDSWEAMGEWYWGLVHDQLQSDDEVRRHVAELTRGLTDDRAKVRAIYDYVVQKTRYVALEFGIMGFKPYRCAQIFARGFGDCKDKATLIVTMLKEVGIPATLVIVRSGMKGLFDTSPASLAPFDHVIAYVPSLDLYLDGTAEYTGSNELPAMDRGALALQINEGKAKLVNLPDPPAADSVAYERMEATMAADATAALDWRTEVSGVDASGWRVSFHADATRRQRVVDLLAGLFPGVEVGNIETGNLEDVEQKAMLHVTAKAPFGRKTEDGIIVPVGPGEHLVRQYASLPHRNLDLRFGPLTTTVQEWIVHLPPRGRVVRGPTPAHGASAFGSYEVVVDTATAGTVRVKTTLTKAKSRITPADYAAFAAYCAEVDRALGQRVTVAVP
jgi:tetratricopeptide (TPR) repeat protein/transglutaminase-like putative cysteine protease